MAKKITTTVVAGPVLLLGVMAAPGASGAAYPAAGSGPGVQAAAGSPTVQAATEAAAARKRIKPGRIRVTVSGTRLGKGAPVTVKGVKGKAKGTTRTVTVKKRAALKRLQPGAYRVRAATITAGGRTAKATVKPRRAKVTHKRGAAVAVRYPATSPSSPTTPPASPPAAPPPIAPPASPPPSSPPPTTPPAQSNADTVTAGSAHTCAIASDGKAWCWGHDSHGEVGDGDADQGNKSTPAAVAGGHTLTSLAAGSMQTCGIDSTGKLWCWGNALLGQLPGTDLQGRVFSPAALPDGRTWKQS